MLEKNHDILKHAISMMPVRKPKASGWEGVSGSLDKIDSGGATFQQGSSLPVHRAPAGAWNKIAASIPAPPFSFITTFWGKMIIGGLIVGVLLTAYLLIPERAKENKTIAVSEEHIVPSSTKEEINTWDGPEEADLTISTSSSAEIIAPITNMVTANDAVEAPAEKALSLSAGRQSQTYSVQTSPVVYSNTISGSQATERPLLNYTEPRKPVHIGIDRYRELKKRSISSSELPEQINYARDMNKAKLKAGAFYAYKVFQDIEHEEMNIPSALSSFGIDLTYEKNRWFFRTGLSYMGWKEKGIYTFDYDQNQMVYLYNYVDSAFIDPGNGSVTYYTTPREVYDSVPGMLNDQAVYEYRYLQIPVILGYSFLDRKKFSLAILGGAGFDIRLSGKQFIPVFSEEDASVKETSNSLKYRANQNWRILLGLEAAYHLTPAWELFAEPGYQWYMKPVYAPDNTNGLGLFNIKLGLRYIF